MMTYLFFKWIHIVAVISWMAGVLYLYRLFVYHSKYGKQSLDNRNLLKTMENKLYKVITIPAMITSWVCGLVMLHLNPSLAFEKWLHVKVFCVILLTGFTHWASFHMRRFQNKDLSYWDHKIFILLNEVPTVLMLMIVGMVVFRPFQ